MAGDDVTAEPITDLQRSLQVDPSSHRQLTESRAAARLRAHFDSSLPGRRRHHRQTDTIDGQRCTERQRRRQQLGADHHPLTTATRQRRDLCHLSDVFDQTGKHALSPVRKPR